MNLVYPYLFYAKCAFCKIVKSCVALQEALCVEHFNKNAMMQAFLGFSILYNYPLQANNLSASSKIVWKARNLVRMPNLDKVDLFTMCRLMAITHQYAANSCLETQQREISIRMNTPRESTRLFVSMWINRFFSQANCVQWPARCWICALQFRRRTVLQVMVQRYLAV